MAELPGQKRGPARGGLGQGVGEVGRERELEECGAGIVKVDASSP